MSAAMGRLAITLLAGALLAIGGGLATLAQTEPAANEAQPRVGNAEADAEQAADEDPQNNEGQPESPEVFLPTEEISEDFAVPFPVDI